MLDLCLSVAPLCCVEGSHLEFSRNGSSRLIGTGSDLQTRPEPLLGNLRRAILDSNNSNHDGRDGLLAAKLQRELTRSNYRLADVRCEIDSSTIHLFGIVKSYHALQMAIQIAREMAAGRRIELEVDVVPRLYEDGVEEARPLEMARN